MTRHTRGTNVAVVGEWMLGQLGIQGIGCFRDSGKINL